MQDEAEVRHLLYLARMRVRNLEHLLGETPKVFLSRRNLATLQSKLDRKKQGEQTTCTIIKRDNLHPVFPQTLEEIEVVAVEDNDYYTDRCPGIVHHRDEPALRT